MNSEDIRKNLLLQSDANTLVKLCNTDTISRNICASKHFWEEKYLISGIPMKRIFKSARSNLIEYSYAEKCFEKASEIFNRDDGVVVTVDNPDKIDIFDLEGVDYEVIRDTLMPHLKDYIDDVSLYDVIMNNSLNIILDNEDGIYNLINDDKFLQVNIDPVVAFNIIYNSIYKGNNVVLQYANSVFKF